EGIFVRIDPGGVMTQRYQDLAIAADDVHRNVIATRLAGIDCGERDRGRDGTGQILVLQQLGIRRGGEPAGKRRRQRRRSKMTDFRHETPPVVYACRTVAAWPS